MAFGPRSLRGAGRPAALNRLKSSVALAASVTVSAAVSTPAAPAIALTPGAGQISVSWTDNAANGAAITSHKLYRGTASGSRTLVGTINTSSPYVDTGLTNGAAYFYSLSAVNSAGEGVQSAEVSATPVAPAAAKVAQMNFTQANPANNAAWNDIITNNAKSPATIALKDPTGAATGWAATWTLAPQYDNNLGNTGIAGIPDNIAATSVYTQTDTGQKSQVLRISGLVPNNSYKIQSYNSRTANGSAARPITISATGGSVQVDALGNSTIVSLPTVTSDANGNLDITFAQVGTTAFVHLNALILTENTPGSGGSGGTTTPPASGSAPSNAVTYGGDPVTYSGDFVTYGA